MNEFKILDCTLRDGAYIVNAEFGTPAIRGIIEKLQQANVEIIECGWLKDTPHKEGTTFFHVPSDVIPYINEKKENITYTVMIDWDRYDLSQLPVNDGKGIDAIRVVFPHGKYKEGIEVGRKIKEKGYRLFYQLANTLAYSDDELRDVSARMNEVMPESVSIVDTFGAMYEEDIERISTVLNEALDQEILLGFHSHNNQQLAFALAVHFARHLKDAKRGIVIDASLSGMGRGAGNATTELITNFMNRKFEKHYDLDAIMDAIDTFMSAFQEKYEWGYSTPYFIAGVYCCHVNNIAYLLKNHRVSAKEMRNVIESMSPEDRLKYDYDLLEEKYLANQTHVVDDTVVRTKLQEELAGKEIVLICPGKTSIEDAEKIRKVIEEKNAVVIGVNAALPGYKYDYLFFINPGRFDYAKQVLSSDFDKVKKIVASNITTESSENVNVIAYDNIVKRGFIHYDNAAICCFRLMEYLGISSVSIAGFDGFKNHYNESYADPNLPTINPGNGFEELNVEIKNMVSDFWAHAKEMKEIHFITESIFE